MAVGPHMAPQRGQQSQRGRVETTASRDAAAIPAGAGLERGGGAYPRPCGGAGRGREAGPAATGATWAPEACTARGPGGVLSPGVFSNCTAAVMATAAVAATAHGVRRLDGPCRRPSAHPARRPAAECRETCETLAQLAAQTCLSKSECAVGRRARKARSEGSAALGVRWMAASSHRAVPGPARTLALTRRRWATAAALVGTVGQRSGPRALQRRARAARRRARRAGAPGGGRGRRPCRARSRRRGRRPARAATGSSAAGEPSRAWSTTSVRTSSASCASTPRTAQLRVHGAANTRTRDRVAHGPRQQTDAARRLTLRAEPSNSSMRPGCTCYPPEALQVQVAYGYPLGDAAALRPPGGAPSMAAPLHAELAKHIDLVVADKGQHDHHQLSPPLNQELGLGEPDAHLAVGSGSHAEQHARDARGDPAPVRSIPTSIARRLLRVRARAHRRVAHPARPARARR